MCEYVFGFDFLWSPITATALHTAVAQSDSFRRKYGLNYSLRSGQGQGPYLAPCLQFRSLHSKENVAHLHPSVPLDPKLLEMWRIHPSWNVDGCLTFSFASEKLSWEVHLHSPLKYSYPSIGN